jgi:hypothetical protein
MTCVSSKELARHMAGDLSAKRAEALEEHVAGCERCAKLQEELGTITTRLAPGSREFVDPAFAHEVMTLVKLGRAESDRGGSAKRGVRWPWLLAPAAAAAVAVSLLFLAPTADQVAVGPGVHASGTEAAGIEPGFQARGSAEERPDRWVSLSVYRAAGEGYEPVEGSLATDDALVFAYEDRSPKPYAHLMVFAVDESGRVFWYYPAYQREGEPPRSVRTVKHQKPVRLPEQIKHDLVPGRLRLFALFSREALDVRSVEGTVARRLKEVEGSLERLLRLPLAGTGQHCHLLRVESPRGGNGP